MVKKQIAWVGGCLICLMISLLLAGAKQPETAKGSPVITTTSMAVSDTLVSSRTDSIPPVIISPSSVGEVTFPHLQHIEDFEIECKTCHHEINAAKLEFPHENYFDDFWIDCKVCHHESGAVISNAQPCSKCHHSYPAKIADETLSAKVVIHKSCWTCHETGTGKDASANCKFCHSGPKTKL